MWYSAADGTPRDGGAACSTSPSQSRPVPRLLGLGPLEAAADRAAATGPSCSGPDAAVATGDRVTLAPWGSAPTLGAYLGARKG